MGDLDGHGDADFFSEVIDFDGVTLVEDCDVVEKGFDDAVVGWGCDVWAKAADLCTSLRVR